MRRLLILVAAAACAACSDSSGPVDNGAPLLAFEMEVSSEVDPAAPRTVVTGGAGRIDVAGETYTICRTNVLVPELRVNSENTWTILVSEIETERCAAQLTGYEYDAAITRMPPGRYHLQILFIHARGITPPRTVFHDFVVVS